MEYVLAVLEIFCKNTGMNFSEALAWLEKMGTDENNPWEDDQ